jgi:hypothetical protein
MKNSTSHFKFITVLFFVSLCVYACKKDATIQSGLVGTWIYSHAYDKGEVIINPTSLKVIVLFG